MDRSKDHVNEEGRRGGVGAGRRMVVYGVVAVIVLGHAYDIIRQQEHWPFSNYPMWARLSRDWHVSAVVPVGVTDDPARPEVELSDPAYFAPMPLHFQRLTFTSLRRASARRDKVLGDYLRRYEQLRRSDQHGGPALVGVRLYERYWDMNTHASNAAAPDRATLLYEYRPSQGPATTTTTAPTEAAGGH